MHRHAAITPYWCGDSAQSADSLVQLPYYFITDDALTEEGRYLQQLNMFSVYENLFALPYGQQTISRELLPQRTVPGVLRH